MNYELYQKKYQYERLINVLQNNYNNLNDVYYSLISCRKIIKESIEIAGALAVETGKGADGGTTGDLVGEL